MMNLLQQALLTDQAELNALERQANKQSDNKELGSRRLENKEPDSQAWHANLMLRFAQTQRGVRLVEKQHQGPLYVQKPFYPEGVEAPHVYLLHPPGGLVSGDCLSIDINVEHQAHALITTPGAGRLYKSRPDQRLQRQQVTLNLASASSIEWLPMEAIVFPDANASASNCIHLEENAHVIFWDVLSLGLPANQKTFDQGSISQNIKIYRKQRLLLQERMQVNDVNRNILESAAGFAGYQNQGVLIAGPFTTEPEELLHHLREQFTDCDEPLGITYVGEFLVVRALSKRSDLIRQRFVCCWSYIRPALLNRPICEPRIWNT